MWKKASSYLKTSRLSSICLPLAVKIYIPCLSLHSRRLIPHNTNIQTRAQLCDYPRWDHSKLGHSCPFEDTVRAYWCLDYQINRERGRLMVREEVGSTRSLMLRSLRNGFCTFSAHPPPPPGLPIKLRGNFSSAAVTMAEKMVAAPPMSALMASMLAEGLMEMPPLQRAKENYRTWF